MKKKYIALALVAAVIVLGGILIHLSSSSDTPTEDSKAVTVNLEPEETKKHDYSSDKMITVTLPADFVDPEYKNNLDSFAQAKGYEWAEPDGEENVKIRMQAFTYGLLLTSIGMKTMDTIGDAIDSGDFPFAHKLAKYESDFSYLVFSVDREKYEKAENKDEFFEYVAAFALYYQDFDERAKGKCEIVICEKDTNILIEERQFTEKDLM